VRLVQDNDERSPSSLTQCFRATRARQVRGVAVHAEDRFGHDDLELVGVGVVEQALKLVQAVVREDAHRQLRWRARVDQRGVNELVEQEAHAPLATCALRCDRLDRRVVRLVSAGQEHRRLGALPRRQRALGGLVQRRVSGHQRAKRRCPRRASGRVGGCANDVRMSAQPEVVV
jgi:hypothetical protein